MPVFWLDQRAETHESTLSRIHAFRDHKWFTNLPLYPYLPIVIPFEQALVYFLFHTFDFSCSAFCCFP